MNSDTPQDRKVQPHTAAITLTPIGCVRSSIEEPMHKYGGKELEKEEKIAIVRRHRRRLKTHVCQLVVAEELVDLLEGIEGFSHILVLYWPHLQDAKERTIRSVHPMGRKDLPRQGVFATCTPTRPNPVLVTAVRLLGRRGNILEVEGLEAVDGSPILDIKPYSPNYMGVENPTLPAWMEKIRREVAGEES